MKNTISLILIGVIFCSGCGKSKKADTSENQIQVEHPETIAIKSIAPLEEGEVIFSEKSFGDIIELKGENRIVEEIFRVSSSQMVIKDNYLILNNAFRLDVNYPDMDPNEHITHSFMIYSLPDMKFVKSLGRQGRGPGELGMITSIFISNDDDKLCFIFDPANCNMYYIGIDMEIHPVANNIEQKDNNRYSDKQFAHMGGDNFACVESVPHGKAIFEMTINGDSVSTSELYNLAFSPQHRNWAAYLGDFGTNPDRNRMVYAYKYFKRLLLLDTNSGKIRTVDFKADELKVADNIGTLGPDNVTYYWGMSAQRDYIYCIYSGRTPLEVTRELGSNKKYIFVEQFDWNGNPIRKFRLDNWGYFCVNEQEDTIYMVSTTNDDPFLVYKLPGLD